MILFTMLPMEGLGYILRPFIKGSCCDGDRVQQEDCKKPGSQNDARQAGGGKALISFSEKTRALVYQVDGDHVIGHDLQQMGV